MSTRKIKLLDCTLRDGGYANNWCFGVNNIEKIISNLISSNIDYIEVGYLKEDLFSDDYSLFSIKNDIRFNQEILSRIAFMIDYEKINHNELFKNIEKFKSLILRVAFKKNNLKNALEFSQNLKNLGCNISLNPMNTVSYTDEELEYLLKVTNEIKPSSLVVVDTNGQMTQNDVLKIAKYFDEGLNLGISLGFHSHNNLCLSFENSVLFTNSVKNREVIIDSTLFGIGRGAGNLKTEEIAKYLNNIEKKYNTDILPNIINDCILPIYKNNSWGQNLYFELCAKNCCHPNYALYLMKNKISHEEIIDKILKNIPNANKDMYNEKLISDLCKNWSLNESFK